VSENSRARQAYCSESAFSKRLPPSIQFVRAKLVPLLFTLKAVELMNGVTCIFRIMFETKHQDHWMRYYLSGLGFRWTGQMS
jgi:hypothetical protein